ncbi:MAG: high frequency lysogenization protein HflD [Serratia symbiotica]|nr:high frequency lysogenization protein HflD [Serratia symbiotica]
MAKNYYDITLAIAGISQSARLVQQLAKKGQCDHEAFHTSMSSLLQINSHSTLAVFGGEERKIKVGLETLMALLNANNKGAGAELTRYTLSLMVLERKLQANKQAMQTLGDRLSRLDRQLAHFDFESDMILSALAGMYVDVVSPLGPRIQVIGSSAILQNPQVQSKVRAVLLAGIRAAVLWQQVGGSRLQLMFSRHRLLKQAMNIIADC